MTLQYPSHLSLAATPTPLQPLDRLSADLGGPRIWVKRDDLTGLLVSGNKIRKLEFVVAQALAEGCDTLITCGGVQSNHCRSTAAVAAQLGLQCHLLLREDSAPEPEGNLLLNRLLGAHVSTFPKSEYRSLPELLRRAQARCGDAGSNAFVIPTGASDEVGVWGYVRACEELREDFRRVGIVPRYLVMATGSGGTQTGLSAGCELFQLSCRVVGMAVCDSEEYFNNKVKSDLRAWKRRYGQDLDLDKVRVTTRADTIGEGYAIAAPAVYETIARVARREGILLDPVYTGKAFHGLLDDIRAGHYAGERDIVFLHTGGLYGNFPHARKFPTSVLTE